MTYFELLGLLTIVSYRIDPSRRLAQLSERITSWLFQRRVAAYAIRHRVDAVIMYDCNARWCFEILARKAPDILRIIDNAHPVRNYLHELYRANDAAHTEFAVTLQRDSFIQSARVAARYGVEARTANVHIAASSFSRDSLRFNGIDDRRIMVVPYGVDFDVRPQAKPEGAGLRVLFVGELSQRKGIGQVLMASKRLRERGVKFVVVGGGGDFHPELYEAYADFVEFRGRLTRAEVENAYSVADVLIFPSMGDGFGLVVLEAMAAGLPVICSTNSVGSDVVEDYVNGFVIRAGDTEALVEHLQWLDDHRPDMERMGKAARETAGAYTWERYEQAIVDGLLRLSFPCSA